eukprot:6199804-Pleurochrysis_carterae.AAC.1
MIGSAVLSGGMRILPSAPRTIDFFRERSDDAMMCAVCGQQCLDISESTWAHAQTSSTAGT